MGEELNFSEGVAGLSNNVSSAAETTQNAVVKKWLILVNKKISHENQ